MRKQIVPSSFYSTLVILSMVVLSACSFILFDRREITSGKFGGFAIGDSKEVALEQIRHLAINAMGAAPPHRFYAYPGHTQDLVLIRDTDVIAINSSAGASSFRFVNGISEFILRPTKLATAQILDIEHKNIEDFRTKLTALLNGSDHASAYPILADVLPRTVFLDGSRSELNAFVQQRDAWIFDDPTEKPQGAEFTLNFSEGRLTKIDYFRNRTSITDGP
jgi:hypothetical protein